MKEAPVCEPREIAIPQEVGGSWVGGHALDGCTLIGLGDQGVAPFEPMSVAYVPHDRPPLLPPHYRTRVFDRWGTIQRPFNAQSLNRALDHTLVTPVPRASRNMPSSSPDRYAPTSWTEGSFEIRRLVTSSTCSAASSATLWSGEATSLNALSTAAISESSARLGD